MKKIIILIVTFTFIFSQSEQPYPPLKLISMPTAGTLPKGTFTFETLLMNKGGLLPSFSIGITDHFTISCMEGEEEIDSFENQLVSLIPENRSVVSSKGLEFELDKTTITIDGKNISNRSKKDIFKIVSSEKLLVFQSHE